MEVTLKGDGLGRVVGTIACNGAQATVTGSDSASAMTDLRLAFENAVAYNRGECFWHEATGDYWWLFKRDGATMRVVILRSVGTLTGWEHRFWAECNADDFRDTLGAAIEACGAS